ncbi:MAG: PAS domain-containing protein, partial [Deltaproteobacteria bacterium]|nr:PAS domain-containing protein [Deltaproteobacteria bacterium]
MTQVPEGSPEAETIAALRAEAEAGAEARRFLESVLTAAPAFIMRVDAAERIVFMNQFVGGFRPETLYGTPFTAFVPEPFLPAARAAIRAAIERGERGYYETEAEGPGGYYGYYVSHVAPLATADGTRHATVVAVDVTAQREREARLGAREAALRLAVEATGLATWDWEPRTGRIAW